MSSGGVVVANQPGVYLVDVDGNVLSADDGTTIANHEGILIAGKDGTTLRFMRVAADGTLRIDPTGTTTQPISAATLPLPTGAATETKLEAVRALLATIDADTSNLDVALSTLATESKLEAVRVLLASLDGKDYATQTTLAAILVDTGQIEALLTAIDADTSALAAVDYATQTTLAALLSAFNAEDFSTQTTLAALLAAFNAEDFASETTLAAAKAVLDTIYTRQADGNQKAIMRSGAKGTSVAADITSTPFDANTEALHVDIIDSEASRQAAKLVVAAYHAAALSGSTDIVMIDLSDAGGDYRHVGSSSIKMTQISGSIVKSSIGAQWKAKVGIILAINGTAATIYWSDGATLFALDTSAVEQHKATVVPSAISFEVSAGALLYFSGGFIEAGVTEFNTGATLPNVVGNATTPAVGDMVLRVTQVSGGGTAEVAYAVRYLVD